MYAIERIETTDGVIENLSYESHRRGKNWIATVKADRSAPGGLARDFWPRVRGGRYGAVPPTLSVGDVIEHGGDYYSGSGRKCPDRRYTRVCVIGDGYLIVAGAWGTYPQARDAEAPEAAAPEGAVEVRRLEAVEAPEPAPTATVAVDRDLADEVAASKARQEAQDGADRECQHTRLRDHGNDDDGSVILACAACGVRVRREVA